MHKSFELPFWYSIVKLYCINSMFQHAYFLDVNAILFNYCNAKCDYLKWLRNEVGTLLPYGK